MMLELSARGLTLWFLAWVLFWAVVGWLRAPETKRRILAVYEHSDLPRTLDTLRFHLVYQHGQRWATRATVRRLVRQMLSEGALIEVGGCGSGLYLPKVPR